jgi:glutathione S-transferase
VAKEKQKSILFTIFSIMKAIVVSKSEEIPKEAIDGKPTIVYWNMLGLVQSIRLILAFVGVDAVDVRIEAGDPQSGDYKRAYFAAKAEFLHQILAIPNLPYYLDGEVSLTQSNTILRYLGNKHDLMGEEPITDLVLEELSDMEVNIIALAYDKGADATIAWYQSDVPSILVPWSKLLAGKDYLSGGDRPSIADFKLYSYLYKLRHIHSILGGPTTADKIPGDLMAYMHRIEELPGIKEYIISPYYMKSPLYNPAARWRG